MCNRYGLNIPIARMNADMSDTRVRLVFPSGMPNLEPREEINITDTAPIIRGEPDAAELVQMRWSWPSPQGKPVFNFRSEGRRFDKGRCLIPASHFYEFTGEKGRKTKWRFTLPGDALFCIAGLWRPGVQGAPDAFTMLTCEPGPDIAPYHNRQVVVLRPAHWAAWLSSPQADVLQPLPAGSLAVAAAA